jgi:hypothetical protein
MYNASYGQACVQDLHPMHRSLSKSTIPSSRLYNAVTGHIVTQGALLQWLQRITENERVEFGKIPSSIYFTQVLLTPTGTSCSLLHATVHAWQPMQDLLSIMKPNLLMVFCFRNYFK